MIYLFSLLLARSKHLAAVLLAILLGSFSVAHAAQSVSLAWNASTGLPTGYRIHYGTSSTNLTQSQDVHNLLQGSVSSLTSGQTYYFDVTAYNAAGNESLASNQVSMTASGNPTPTPSPSPTPSPTPTPTSSLFASTDLPSTVNSNDPNGVELGVKFQTSIARQVLGIRFYKGRRNTGYHTGNLWSSSGALLSSAVFTNETRSGWQQVNLTSPVTLAPGATYIVSYYSHGDYSVTPSYFNTPHLSGSLTAPSTASSGGNGVYSYGASSSFPRNSYQASNYWIDILLK